MILTEKNFSHITVHSLSIGQPAMLTVIDHNNNEQTIKTSTVSKFRYGAGTGISIQTAHTIYTAADYKIISLI